MYFVFADKPESAQLVVDAPFIFIVATASLPCARRVIRSSTGLVQDSVTVVPETAADRLFSATGGFSDTSRTTTRTLASAAPPRVSVARTVRLYSDFVS